MNAIYAIWKLLFSVFSSQIQRWGNVEWAHDYDMYELRARTAAGALFVHLSSESSSVKRKLMQDWEGFTRAHKSWDCRFASKLRTPPLSRAPERSVKCLFYLAMTAALSGLQRHLTQLKHLGCLFRSVYMWQLPNGTRLSFSRRFSVIRDILDTVNSFERMVTNVYQFGVGMWTACQFSLSATF